MEQLESHWKDFREIWYLSIFRNSAEKIRVSLKSDKNTGYFTWKPMSIYDNISSKFFLECEIFQKQLYRKSKHTLYIQYSFIQKSCLLWDIVEKHGRARQATDDDILRRMRTACFIRKVTDTLRLWNTYCFSTAKMVTRKPPSPNVKVHTYSTLPFLFFT